MRRGFALFLGGYTLLDLAGQILHPGFDGDRLWVDLGGLPVTAARTLLVIAGVFLVWLAVRPRPSRPRRIATAGVLVLLIAAAITNSVRFYFLLADGRIRTTVPVPITAFVVVLLVVVLAGLRRRPDVGRPSRWGMLVALPALAIAFPLAQMIFFGGTDYRRPADAIVVFGARAYRDGKPSQALADRVRTACELWREGLAPVLVMSGGPGDGEIHETESMRRLAIQLGVPPEAILLDPGGVNTRATVSDTVRMFEERGTGGVLAVSHAFHLPRVKMTYARAGRQVFTVPARESKPLTQMPYLMAREVAAFWTYWLEGVARY